MIQLAVAGVGLLYGLLYAFIYLYLQPGNEE
jgi:hypothetical protein